MSILCDQVIQILNSIFPETRIVEEKSIRVDGKVLYLDIWLPDYDIIIEVHGNQHDSYVRHFHKDSYGFTQAKNRDRIKKNWALSKGYTFIELRTDVLPINEEDLKRIIYDSYNT